MSTRPESFLERWFWRRSKLTKAKTQSRYLQSSHDQSVEAPVSVISPSPNTHPLLTRPFPRDEALRGSGQIPESRCDSTTAAVINGHYTSWHSPQSPDINLQIHQTEVISEYSGHDCTFEWGFFDKCYAEVCILMNRVALYGLHIVRAGSTFPILQSPLHKGLSFSIIQPQLQLTRLIA